MQRYTIDMGEVASISTGGKNIFTARKHWENKTMFYTDQLYVSGLLPHSGGQHVVLEDTEMD